MAKWQRTIHLQPEWGQAHDGEISLQELAGVIAKRLRAMSPFTGLDEWADEQRIELADEFQWMSEEQSLDVDHFDGWMSQLYDWADQGLDNNWNGRKVCWVNTLAPVGAAQERE